MSNKLYNEKFLKLFLKIACKVKLYVLVYVQQSNARARRAKENMKIIKKIKKEVSPAFTEKDLTDMYAEKVLNDLLKDDIVESGYIVYLGKTWKDGAQGTITTSICKGFDAAYDEHYDNKSFCDGGDKASVNCYYCAFLGKILKKGVACLIDAYAVEN